MQEIKNPAPEKNLPNHYSEITFLDYRQKILRVLLLAAVAGATGLAVLNLVEWVRDPLIEWGIFNLVADGVVIVAFAGLWRMNQLGYVTLAGWGFTVIVFISVPLSYSPPYFGQSLVVISLPVAISSFIIHPLASFLFAGITILLYTLDFNLSHASFDFDIFSLFALTVLTVGAYLVSNTLNKTIQEVVHAYDETIRGWAIALEMRDSVTLGHSQRVVELTLSLAKKLGIKDSELVHIRRGVLLHDIGKMAIPDAILHKPEPLTAEEWEVMKQHPQYAREYLLGVSYLSPALDIPYCHHERWDGNGYPRGLKGEAIPLSARIFTIVDVWDALTTDRPYRPAWAEEKALEYIQQEAGKQLDPQIVVAFIELIKDQKPGSH